MRRLVVGGLNTHLTKPPGEYKNKQKTQKQQLNSEIPGRESRNKDSRPGIVDSRPGIVSQIQIDLAGSGRMKANLKTQVIETLTRIKMVSNFLSEKYWCSRTVKSVHGNIQNTPVQSQFHS